MRERLSVIRLLICFVLITMTMCYCQNEILQRQTKRLLRNWARLETRKQAMIERVLCEVYYLKKESNTRHRNHTFLQKTCHPFFDYLLVHSWNCAKGLIFTCIVLKPSVSFVANIQHYGSMTFYGDGIFKSMHFVSDKL